MTDFKSNFRDRYRHPNVVVTLDENLEFGAPSIQAYFEDQIRQGTVFRAGETVQIGWMIVMLKADERGDLEVWEPHFGAVPITWMRGVSNTFRHLLLQKTVCEQIGIEPLFPTLRQSAFASIEFLRGRNFRMFRTTSEGTDSGWVFTDDRNVGAEGKVCSLFEIAGSHPDVIPFLALPFNTSVTCADGRIQINSGNTAVSSGSNDFFNRLATR